MNPLYRRILTTVASTLLALIAARLLGFEQTFETLIGAFFVGGVAAAFLAQRIHGDRPAV